MAAVKPLASHDTRSDLAVAYRLGEPAALLADDQALAVIGFGAEPVADDPRLIQVPLTPLLTDPAPHEVWRVRDRVERGHEGDCNWARGGGFMMVALRIGEAEHGGIETAAEVAYTRLMHTLAEHGHRHLLRAWNYVADINVGVDGSDSDRERYRRFSIGRARGIGQVPPERFPAATAIGRLDGVTELVVYALAGREPGRPIENPRQVSAYRYPRQYGPVPPSFARAMGIDGDSGLELLISGTSSVVGHATAHERAVDQIAETLLNLDSLARAAGLGEHLPYANACLKGYLRHAEDAVSMRTALIDAGLPPEQLLCLHGDICRADLMVEIDGIAVQRG